MTNLAYLKNSSSARLLIRLMNSQIRLLAGVGESQHCVHPGLASQLNRPDEAIGQERIAAVIVPPGRDERFRGPIRPDTGDRQRDGPPVRRAGRQRDAGPRRRARSEEPPRDQRTDAEPGRRDDELHHAAVNHGGGPRHVGVEPELHHRAQRRHRALERCA